MIEVVQVGIDYNYVIKFPNGDAIIARFPNIQLCQKGAVNYANERWILKDYTPFDRSRAEKLLRKLVKTGDKKGLLDIYWPEEIK